MADYETGRFFPLSFLSFIANPTSAEKLLILSHEVVRVARMVRAKVLRPQFFFFSLGFGELVSSLRRLSQRYRGLRGRVGLPVQTLALTFLSRRLL